MITRLMSLAIFLAMTSCIDEYWPEITKYQNIIVVDGKITSDPGPYTVQLSFSTDVNLPQLHPYASCLVSIHDDEGNFELLEEYQEGIYKTSPSGLQGIVGRSYRIHIETPDGQEYDSEFEELLEPVEIESVYAVIETREDTSTNHDLEGYQFYINTHPVSNDSSYFLWQLEYTYKYKTDFRINYMFDGRMHFVMNTDTLRRCWLTDRVHEIFTTSTAGLTEPAITKFPLHYVSTETRALTIRYSLMVRQYTMSEPAYRYWNSLYEQEAGQGGLYSKQPYQINGNIVNKAQPDQPVLGYFLVAGIREKRIYVDRPNELTFYHVVCKLTDADFEAYMFIYMTSSSEWPLYVTISLDNNQRALPHQLCIDCTKRGGTLIKPDFWTD